jgi:septal ring factor EnvC (AmiA/AmiB activator)
MNRSPARSVLAAWIAVACAGAPIVERPFAHAAERGPRLSRRIQDKRDELTKVRRELDQERRQATRAARQEQSLFDELDRINRELQQKARELKALQDRLRASTARLQAIRGEITRTRSVLDEIHGRLRMRLRAIYKQGRLGYMRALLGADDLEQGARRVKYLAMIANQDQRMVAAYATAIEDMQKKQDHLEASKRELDDNQRAVAAKRREILKDQEAKRRLLAAVQEQKKAHQAAVRQLSRAAGELQDLISRLQQEARALARRRPVPDAAPGAPGPAHRGSFTTLKGQLPWPTHGTVASSFGRQEHPRYKTVTFNRGIEISAPEGQEFVAVSGGSVLYADWFKGYGRLVVLDHGDGYYTVYAHASDVAVQVGDQVARGQRIGLVGDTGSPSGPQLYFEVRHRGRPQDPLAWLAPK